MKPQFIQTLLLACLLILSYSRGSEARDLPGLRNPEGPSLAPVAARIVNYGSDGDVTQVDLGGADADAIVLLTPIGLKTLPSGAAPSDAMIEDFEGPSPLSSWYFGAGNGASGSLSLTTGHAGKGARLAFNFSSGEASEAYVYAYHPLSAPQSAPAVAFWLISPPGVIIKLQVSDNTGQTLQYPLVRPFDQREPTAWYRHVVKLDPTPEHWGGANDGELHGSIHSVTILAADLWNAKSVGAVDFDEVALVDPILYDLNPYVQAAVPAPAGSGSLASRLGVNIHFPSHPNYEQDDQALDAARSAGFTWVRHDMPWPAVEQSGGVYTFTPYDQLVTALETRDMQALFILDQGHDLYTGGWLIPPTTPAAIQAFGNYAEASARHYAGRPVAFEVWNEPNIANFWPPAPDASQYAALAQETIASVHSGNASASISTGGLSTFDYPFLRSYLSTGCADAADAIGIHPYHFPRPEPVSDHLLLMQSIVQQMVPANPPIWDTEWGYSSAAFGNGHSAEARARQAILVARELLSTWAMGFPLIVYYDIRDDGTDANNWEHNFGLLTYDYSEKPALQAVRTLSTLAAERTLVGFLPTQPSSLHTMLLQGTNDMVVALWSDAPGGQVDVILPPFTTGMNYLGAPLTFIPISGGLSFTIRENEGPVYLIFPLQERIYLPLAMR